MIINSEIQLVITVAVKKEIPKDWFISNGVAVHTLAALKSGAMRQQVGFHSGILVIVTGTGLKVSEEAACWIRDNVAPLFVINVGTCGLINRVYPLGTWLLPQHVTNESSERLLLDDRLPIPYLENFNKIHSLLSITKPGLHGITKSDNCNEAVDMECYSQAKIFSKTNITFHCLKFGSDYSDSNTTRDFNKNLDLFQLEIKRLLKFIEDGQLKVSAIVPVYNREQTVSRAIDSVFSQALKVEELIVADDASTDGTGAILERYDKSVKVIRLSKNSGPAKARNEGVKHARFDWIAFLDSDDCWDRNKMRYQSEYLKKYPFYEIMQSNEKWIRNGKRVNPCQHHTKPFGWIWEPSLKRCLVSPSGVLVRKSLIERYGNFDETLPVCEDYDLWMKISRNHPVGLDPKLSVVKYGGHSDQLSRKYPAMDRFRVQSLVRLLNNETNPHFRQKIAMELKKKIWILINGYEKRGKFREVSECKKIIRKIPLNPPLTKGILERRTFHHPLQKGVFKFIFQ